MCCVHRSRTGCAALRVLTHGSVHRAGATFWTATTGSDRQLSALASTVAGHEPVVTVDLKEQRCDHTCSVVVQHRRLRDDAHAEAFGNTNRATILGVRGAPHAIEPHRRECLVQYCCRGLRRVSPSPRRRRKSPTHSHRWEKLVREHGHGESDDADEVGVCSFSHCTATETALSPQLYLTIEERFRLRKCHAPPVLELPHLTISEHPGQFVKVVASEAPEREPSRHNLAERCRDFWMEGAHRYRLPAGISSAHAYVPILAASSWRWEGADRRRLADTPVGGGSCAAQNSAAARPGDRWPQGGYRPR